MKEEKTAHFIELKWDPRESQPHLIGQWQTENERFVQF